MTDDIEWLDQKKEWRNLHCIGAIHIGFEIKKGKSGEWYYYISSLNLTPKELLHHAPMEWSVESMHWLLDMHFEEDWCHVEDKNIQQNLNILRKAAINLIKQFKNKTQSKKAMSKIMFDCLLDSQAILRVLEQN